MAVPPRTPPARDASHSRFALLLPSVHAGLSSLSQIPVASPSVCHLDDRLVAAVHHLFALNLLLSRVSRDAEKRVWVSGNRHFYLYRVPVCPHHTVPHCDGTLCINVLATRSGLRSEGRPKTTIKERKRVRGKEKNPIWWSPFRYPYTVVPVPRVPGRL